MMVFIAISFRVFPGMRRWDVQSSADALAGVSLARNTCPLDKRH